MATLIAPVPQQLLTETPRRLDYLDGVRGIAALYVVLHHLVAEVKSSDGPSAVISSLLAHGHDGVVVFIVLSGYCLMLPVLRSPDGSIRGGFLGYLMRRARRILPPYYATILLVLALVAAVPAMGRPNGSRWDQALPVTGTGTLVSHFLLVHNLSWRYIGKIDMPMWSVATEWQIYFVFPLLLLVRRHVGSVASLTFGLLAGYAVIPFSVAIGRGYLQGGCPWMLGSFALGMAAAELSASDENATPDWLRLIPWRLIALSLFFGLNLVRLPGLARYLPSWYWTDLVVGVATACLLVGCTLSTRRGDQGLSAFPRNLFDSRWAIAIGGFSYSLYLIHQPVISLVHLGVRQWHGMAYLAAMLLVALPLCLASGYLLYLAVERRCLPGPKRS